MGCLCPDSWPDDNFTELGPLGIVPCRIESHKPWSKGDKVQKFRLTPAKDPNSLLFQCYRYVQEYEGKERDLTGIISPMADVGLPISAMIDAKIPFDARRFAWANPAQVGSTHRCPTPINNKINIQTPSEALSNHDNKETVKQWLKDPEVSLAVIGGFAYVGFYLQKYFLKNKVLL